MTSLPYLANMQVTHAGKTQTVYFRPGTVDDFIIRQVFDHNEYALPDSMEGMIVIDIGGHVGSFSIRAAMSGAASVLAYEPIAENYAILERNTRKLKAVTAVNQAVWRSDVDYPLELFTDGPTTSTSANTGDANVMFHNEGNTPVGVKAFPLDAIIGDRTIDILKLDCESSEWPILYTSQRLHQCKIICGEFHEVGGLFDTNPVLPHAHVSGQPFTIANLVAYLGKLGFDTRYQRFVGPNGTWSNMGLFYAFNTVQR